MANHTKSRGVGVATALKLSFTEQRILAEIAYAKASGRTCDEIESRLNLIHQTASPMLLQLRNKGVIRIEELSNGDLRQRLTPRGVPAWVYKPTVDGVNYLRF